MKLASNSFKVTKPALFRYGEIWTSQNKIKSKNNSTPIVESVLQSLAQKNSPFILESSLTRPWDATLGLRA